MKYLLIVNPISGPNNNPDSLIRLIKHLIVSAGHEVVAQKTESPGDGKILAKDALEKDYDVVIACGGDGTVNEVGMGLLGSEMPMGIIPNGSGNGLARELCIPMAVDKAVEVLLRHETTRIDTCSCNGEPFFVSCGIGFDGTVTKAFSEMEGRGVINYISGSVSSYLDYEAGDYDVIIDGVDYSTRAFLVAVGNASQYGNNAYIAPNASMTDGLLNITIIKEFPKDRGGEVAFQLFSGDLKDNPYTDLYTGKDITISAKRPMLYHIDGEPRSAVDVLKVNVVPESLTVCTGREKDREKNIFDFFNEVNTSFQKMGRGILTLFGQED